MGNGNLQSCFISIGAYQYLCSATSQKGRGDSHPSGLNVYMKPLLAGPNSSWLSVHTPFHFLSILAKTLSCTRPRSASCIAKAQRGGWEMQLVQCAWSIRSCQFFYFSFYPMVVFIELTDIVEVTRTVLGYTELWDSVPYSGTLIQVK